MHFCGDQLKSVNFFGKAKTCLEKAPTGAKKNCTHPHHAQEAEADQQHQGLSFDKQDCCESRTLRFQADQGQELQMVDYRVHPHLQQLVIAFVTVFFHQPTIDRKAPVFALYRPPLIPRDIPVLVQSFRL
jgi:hypothetical protein